MPLAYSPYLVSLALVELAVGVSPHNGFVFQRTKEVAGSIC